MDIKNLVRKGRLELPRVTPLEPKSSASTNSATFAIRRDQEQIWWFFSASGTVYRLPAGYSNPMAPKHGKVYCYMLAVD